ncbi:SusC/RagA family TonB-linked outer membrane protein [Flavobacterium hydatis]|uniref:SusC/RagA family TonB-linked outer membrane protein n=1 Tax=Flavobacterium hydatis TaxID=991 RepID=A0A086A389_FLAHY|nr:SusC/RagA family TonB-linked outer membrane protein [Flavobacterium hydatis]KFF11153.1 TonB-dependent receptor [Flavobacterium hydatis]OXA97812.1 SusC/RagA family TonB-linked outer membrane protein [Flavobacterium hydatis]
MKNISFCKGREVLWYAFISAIYLTCPDIFAKPTTKYSPTQQQLQISGTITDGVGTMPGVTVGIKGSIISTVTDLGGKYTINAFNTDILIFSYIGYKTVEITIGSQSIINLEMKIDATNLQEVTINAGYYSVKDSERTGSITKISSKDIEKQPVTNVLATMQGRMAGVNITQNTGMPGGGFDIEIRGQNSLRLDGNSPLYIIDGVPYSSQEIGSSYTSGNMPAQNSPLNSINPGNISNIEVLKDADATAIYGSRGANGVVLITTKKGKEGKTSFSTSYSNGYGEVAHFIGLMDTPQYLAMRREAFANDGVTDYPADAYDVNGTWDQNRNTNWQKLLIGGTASYTNIQSSLSGGSAQTQFLLSGNYNKETTVYPGDFDYIKANGHFNLNHESLDQRFKVTFTTGYTAQFNNLPSVDLTRDAITLVPNAPSLYDSAGKLNWENNTFENPLAKLEGKIKGETYDFLTNILLSYDLGMGFTTKTSLGYTDLRQSQMNLLPSTIYNPAYGLGSEVSAMFSNTVNRNSWITEPQLGWGYTIGKGKIEVLAGATFQQQKSNQLVSAAEGFASNSLIENPASAANYLILNSDETLYKYQAFFGRVNLNWQGKYILNLTGRRDGSSRFGPGRQFATFGAVGAAWLFGAESFIKQNLNFLSFGKLRTSYGTSGNDQIGDYQYLDTYSTSGYTYQGINGLQPTRLYNPNFGWETNRKLEAALEMGFLNDRISTTIAWYRNRSSSQLVGIPLPGTTGFAELRANLDAEVQNSGLEFSLRTVNIQGKDFSWISNFNITSAKNELLSFPGLEGSPYKNQYAIGQPVNIVKVYHYTGLNQTTGTYQFEDYNDDGNLSAADDKKIIKNLSPKYYGGFQNQIRYGNVQLDFMLLFVKQQNFNENFRTSMPGTMVNQPEAVINHWQKPGDEGPYQSYSNSNAEKRAASIRYSQSDAAISDASFIRLKNVSISFDLPRDWTKKFFCKISLQAQNLLTITPYKGIDPEFRSSGYLPPLRIITTSLQVTF